MHRVIWVNIVCLIETTLHTQLHQVQCLNLILVFWWWSLKQTYLIFLMIVWEAKLRKNLLKLGYRPKVLWKIGRKGSVYLTTVLVPFLCIYLSLILFPRCLWGLWPGQLRPQRSQDWGSPLPRGPGTRPGQEADTVSLWPVTAQLHRPGPDQVRCELCLVAWGTLHLSVQLYTFIYLLLF